MTRIAATDLALNLDALTALATEAAGYPVSARANRTDAAGVAFKTRSPLAAARLAEMLDAGAPLQGGWYQIVLVEDASAALVALTPAKAIEATDRFDVEMDDVEAAPKAAPVASLRWDVEMDDAPAQDAPQKAVESSLRWDLDL